VESDREVDSSFSRTDSAGAHRLADALRTFPPFSFFRYGAGLIFVTSRPEPRLIPGGLVRAARPELATNPGPLGISSHPPLLTTFAALRGWL